MLDDNEAWAGSTPQTDRLVGRSLDAAIQRRVFNSTDLRRLPVFRDPEGGGMMNGASEDTAIPSLGTPDWCYLPAYDHDEKGDIFCEPVPAYSTDMAAAWEVHRAACNWLFSRRQRYLKALQEQTRTTIAGTGEVTTIAWPDVLVVLCDRMAEAICRAALATLAG